MYPPKCSHESVVQITFDIGVLRDSQNAVRLLLQNMNISKQTILIQYGTKLVINVSAILCFYTESHVPQNNANKLFPVLRKVAICYNKIGTLPVETLLNKLLRCLILTCCEIPKPRDWYLKLSNRSEISQQHSSWFSCQITERSGYFQYQYSGFDTSRESMPVVFKPLPLRRVERKNGSGPILRIRRGHPPPHRHRTAIVEIHNMKTLKPKNPLRPAVTAPLPLRISGNVPLESFTLSLHSPDVGKFARLCKGL